MDYLISVIIINHNGEKFLERCLSSLLRTDYDNLEIIFVDNASTDNSVDYVVNNYKDNRIKIIQNDKNYGVPGGRNIGFKSSKGEFIVFLDNDTEVDSNWLKELVKVFESDSKIAVAQAKLLNMEIRNKFDHAGDFLTPFGFLFERSNQSIDRGQLDKIADILNAKGAATIIKSCVFKELGMYDASYFMYLEETDFCFRVWLAGYRVVFAPMSIVWHAFNTTFKKSEAHYSNYIVRYHGCRNYITTLVKNLGLLNLIRIVPIHILCWLVISLFFLIKGRLRDSFWILKGILWNIIYSPFVLEKRLNVQKNIRKVKDGEFFRKIALKRDYSSYIKKVLCYLNNKPYTEV